VNERGMAILLSSHLLNQVQSVCDRIGIFAAGRLIGQGTMKQLAERFGEERDELEVGFDVRSEADAERARSVLRAVPGVGAIGPSIRPGDPWHVSIVEGADAATVRSAVLAAVAEHQLPLTSIRAVVPSLEDIYRRAVAGPRAQRAAMAHRATGEVPA
jgi:ABC-2 type transport system ATP-binding protein